jgi:hypothetical protein
MPNNPYDFLRIQHIKSTMQILKTSSSRSSGITLLILTTALGVLVFNFESIFKIRHLRQINPVLVGPADPIDDGKFVESQPSQSLPVIKKVFKTSGISGEVTLEWDPDGVLNSRDFNTDTMKRDFFIFLEVWNRRPLKSNPGGMGFHHQFMLWYSVRRVQPKLIVESGMNSGATTWLLHEAAPTASIISFEPMIQRDWVGNITTATEPLKVFQSALHRPYSASTAFPYVDKPTLQVKVDGVEYRAGANFVDVLKYPWHTVPLGGGARA